MADRGDTLYHIPTLNRWFLFASAFFTLTMVWTVLDDSSAEWKDYQREFRAMELEKAEEARAALAAEGLVEQRDSLAEAVAAAEACAALRPCPRSAQAQVRTARFASATASAVCFAMRSACRAGAAALNPATQQDVLASA